MDWLGTINKVLPFLEQYPSWVKVATSAWVLTTAFLACIFLVVPKVPADVCLSIDTGDNVIDAAQKKLCTLHSKKSKPSESDLVNALSPLFSRPAFYGIREENWQYFLFTLSKTRLLLENNVGHFKASPQVRSELGRAIQLMVKLQNDVAKLYGPTFSVTDHIARFINSRTDFTENLPALVSQPDYTFFDERDKTIQEIRVILKPLGLTAW